jgi:glutathione reductase (NADPH)
LSNVGAREMLATAPFPAAPESAGVSDAEFEADLFVIGGGSGGIRAARVAASHGAKVILAEEYRLGGTCVIRGCVPKKLFVYASRFSDAFEEAAEFGWKLSVPHFDWPSLVGAKDREILRLEDLYSQGQERAGVEVLKSRAELEDAHTVRVLADGRRIRARTILIATGARPELPPFDGMDLGITSDAAFDLKEFPKRLVIGGAGYIAMEFASLFAALGSDVTVVCRGSNVLRGFDEDVRLITLCDGCHSLQHLKGSAPQIERGLRAIEYPSVPKLLFEVFAQMERRQ